MKWLTPLWLALALTGAALAAGVDCVSCHTEKTTLKDSIHGNLACADCHAGFKEFPHPDKPAAVNCGSCHAGSVTQLASSVHAGKANCTNCHGDGHAILPSSNPKSATYAANLPRACGNCHAEKGEAQNAGLAEVYSKYMDSIHGFALTKEGLLVAANCSSCHGSHSILSAKDTKSKTNHANIPATCGTCHAGPARDYAAGIHGQMLAAGADGAPVCSDCHTAHQTARVGTAEWQIKTTSTCGNCHKDELTTYRDTFHSQVSALGFRDAAHCWDCHKHHDILPASDPHSAIAPGQLTTTCGKCHAGANAGLVKYDPHADSHDVKRYPALHYSAVFMNLLLSGFLGFCAIHTVLWFLRSRSPDQKKQA